jgi:uncharacterized membrane-anchored protein YitT (DUF2179 family)
MNLRSLILGALLMNNIFTTVVEIVGAALVVAGVAMLSVPAAVITAGLLCICASFLVATR